MQNEKEKTEKAKVLTPVGANFNWQIPECCRQGLPSCKHVVKPIKKEKTNIGL